VPSQAGRFPRRWIALGASSLVGLLVVALGLWIAWPSRRSEGRAAVESAGAARRAETTAPVRSPAFPDQARAPAIETTPVVPIRTRWSLLPPLSPPAALEVNVQHSLRSGRLRVWLDDEALLDEGLKGTVRKKVLAYKAHSGRLERAFEVEPGEHVVRVRIDTGEDVLQGEISGRFESRVRRRLLIDAGGILRKRVTLAWAAP
jgi:hypothetical protein